jgi:hypothetical protein
MKPIIVASLVFAGLGCEAGVQTQPTYARYEPAPVPAPRPVRTQWVPLAEEQAASQQILLRGRGAFRAIRVEGSRGAPVISRVTIDYADGVAPQIVTLNEQLSPGEGRTIDLHGGRQEVKRVIVYTDPQYGGTYSVFGT